MLGVSGLGFFRPVSEEAHVLRRNANSCRHSGTRGLAWYFSHVSLDHVQSAAIEGHCSAIKHVQQRGVASGVKFVREVGEWSRGHFQC